MKKINGSIIGILILIGVLCVVVLFTGSTNTSLAHSLMGREQFGSLQDTDQLEDNAQLSAYAPETGVSGENIAREVQDLSQQWHDANKKAGWIHIVSKYQVDQDELRVLPDGKIMENEYFHDQWFLLDERGYEITHVSIQRDNHGNEIQVSAFRDNTGYNLTYGVRFPEREEAVEFVWDFGFPIEAIRLASSLKKEMILLDGQTVVLYTVTEEYPSPIDFSQYNELVAAIISRAYYEPESGKLLFLERVMIMTSGEERITNTMKLVSWETGVLPPEDVLAYLDATFEDTFIQPSELPDPPEQGGTK